MTALAIVSNYILISIPNVKLMDLIVFVTGFSFGPIKGALVGAMIWLVYGVINPYGFSFPVWISTMIGETVYGIVGGIRGKMGINIKRKRDYLIRSFEMSLWGILTTMFYDVLTNLVFSYSLGINFIQTLIIGLPFTLLHQVSNAVIFFSLSLPLILGIGELNCKNKYL